MIDRFNIWFISYVILMSKQDVWYEKEIANLYTNRCK